MKKVIVFSALMFGLTKLAAAPYQDTISSHMGSVKASFAYTTIGINTSFRLPIFGFGKRIRYESNALDISTQVSTTLMTSAIYVDTAYLRYLFWDYIYVGGGGGVSLGLDKIMPNYLGLNPIVKLGLELARSFHQINYTPLTYTDKIVKEKNEDGSVTKKRVASSQYVHLISYQLGYKY